MVLNQKTGKEREISTINEVRFGILSPEEILNRSVAHINEPNLYDSSGNPRYNGLFDPRMGVIERKRQCLTCKQSYVECPGHFGHIEFAKPVYHMQYIVQIRKILECVCNHCGKLLIAKDNIAIEHALRKNPADRLDFIRLKVKTKICGLFLVGKNKGDESEELHGCGFEKPTKIGSKEHNHVQVEYIKEVKNEETGDVTKEVIEQPYTPDMVLSIFKRISPEDALILGFSKDWCLPHWLIYTVLAVVPPSVRPSVRLHNSQRSEDDITHKYNDIIKQNNQLSEFIKNGDSEELIRDYHHLIQCHVATLVDNNAKGVIGEAKHRTGRPLKTFKQRLHGKEGRIRSNLMGKRVDFSARSVISPDPSLDIDELGVPIKIAMNLTYPEIVNKYNINNLYKLVRNGSKVYPGSNSYTNTEEGVTKTFDHIDTSKIVLKYGDIVNRHLINEDIVLFNRQPSLHKMSMMAHSIKIIPSKTFRFNVDVCKPYNADFDGDEMNMHVPQSIQAATELRYLASVRKQIISPSTNSPIIAPSQDNLLGLYKITEDDVFFTHREVMNLMTKVKAFKGSLPPPAISNGKKIRWSGKQLISMILPPISITISNKNVKCQITKGQIISGRINKTVSTTIVHIIFSEYGFDEAARYMNDLQRIIKGYMVRSGFSIGMSDLIVHKDIRKKNEEYILDTKKDVIDMTKKVHLNIFENITKNIEGVYEAMITKRLSETTNRIQSETTANITEENNRVKYMVASGSKGNATNIMQMMCLVGQQIIDGKRIPLGFSDRSLPHFLRYDNGVESKGFVVNNYLDGLTPTEFFFHAEGGREGLIDTAVKTARSGYLQRKLVKTMEDLKVEHDYTVRNSNNKIVQFIYGNDGFNPIHLQKQTIDNLIVPEDEILEDKYLMDSKEKWDKYMTTKSVSEMKKDNYQNKIKEYNEYLNNMIISINELHQQNISVNKTAEKHRIVLFPVNFDSFLRNIKNIYHLDGKGKSDVSPFEIMDMYKQLYKTAYKNVKTYNRMFSVLMMEKLSPVYLIKYVRITKVALESMLNTILNKYKKALIQGGESVGPIAGQSIGELSTQLTLNTFHLAGVGSKSSVNQGVPRLEELLEQHKPKNPSLNIFLNGEYALDSDKADQVCYNIEIVKIKDIITSDAIYFEPTNDLSDVLEEDRDIMKLYQVFSELDAQSANIPNNPWIIRLEFNRHNMLEKKITMSDINLILKHHLPKSNIVFADDNSGKLIFRIRFDFDSNVNQADDDISLLNEQIEYIKNITIKGVDDILHAYKIENNNKIVKDGDKYVSQKEYMIETTGSNLFDILCKSYVDSSRTYSINVSEMYETFGIEAARWILEKEIIGVFVLSDASTNPRHVKLLCDLMTNRGTIMAANRNGINQSDNEIGPLAKSSFEETIGQLTMAGLYGISDKLKGVSSNIMVGQIPKCGTGYSEILLDEDKLQDIEDDEDSAYAHVDYQDNVDNVNKLFDSSDYCADNNMIQFNIGNIDGDEINLDNISIPINI
mgnify:FL=1